MLNTRSKTSHHSFTPGTFIKTAVPFLCVFLPWINPHAPGPSPGIIPLAFSIGCAILWIIFSCNQFGEVQTKNNLKLIPWAWLGASLLSALMGLSQYFGAAEYFSPVVNYTLPGNAFANLRQRNQFSSLTNIGLVALICLVLKYSSHTDKLTKKRFGLAMVAAGLLALGNAISSSRTGLSGLIFICALFGLWGQWRHALVQKLLVGAVLMYSAVALVMPYLTGPGSDSRSAFARFVQDDACGSRLILWSNVLHLIAQKPWLGWGWGELDYAHFITLYDAPRFCDILDNAHNLPLHLAVELGVPVAVLICGGFIWWALRQKPWAERDATRQMAWAVMAVILLHSMLEYPLWYGPFQMAFAACLLLLWRQKHPPTAENSLKNASNQLLRLILYVPAAIISIAFIGYAAWDYQRISQIYLSPESRSAAYRTDTLNKIRGSWLFADQVQFAELMVTPLSPASAAWTFSTAKALLHYSPEPRVIERLVESAVMLGRDDDALVYLARYRAAFPKEHGLWAKTNAKPD